MLRTPALLLSAVALVSTAHTEATAAISPASCCATQTLQIGTNGSPSGPTKIQYTCTGASAVCGPQIAPQGRWTHTLTVPVGSLVWMHAENANSDASAAPPDCWIADRSGRVIASGQGSCLFQAAPLPPPAAPPSS